MDKKGQTFPTEVVDLPSKGLLYPEGHELSKGTIEVKYMTAKEEDILTSQNLITKGVVLDELLKSLIASKVSLDEIMIGDKNAIMIASRIFGYGKIYSVDTTCPDCGEIEKDCEYDLTTFEHKEINEKLFNHALKEHKNLIWVGYCHSTLRSNDQIQSLWHPQNWEEAQYHLLVVWLLAERSYYLP